MTTKKLLYYTLSDCKMLVISNFILNVIKLDLKKIILMINGFSVIVFLSLFPCMATFLKKDN